MRLLLIPNVIVLMVLSLAGCGKPEAVLVPVWGTVFIDGKPLDKGTIRFVPDAGRPSSSSILSDGSFEIATESVNSPSERGLRPGKYRVQIASSEVIDDATIRWKVPQHYADFRTSGLEVIVDGPTEGMKFELVSESEDHEDDTEAPSDAPSDTQSSETKET